MNFAEVTNKNKPPHHINTNTHTQNQSGDSIHPDCYQNIDIAYWQTIGKNAAQKALDTKIKLEKRNKIKLILDYRADTPKNLRIEFDNFIQQGIEPAEAYEILVNKKKSKVEGGVTSRKQGVQKHFSKRQKRTTMTKGHKCEPERHPLVVPIFNNNIVKLVQFSINKPPINRLKYNNYKNKKKTVVFYRNGKVINKPTKQVKPIIEKNTRSRKNKYCLQLIGIEGRKINDVNLNIETVYFNVGLNRPWHAKNDPSNHLQLTKYENCQVGRIFNGLLQTKINNMWYTIENCKFYNMSMCKINDNTKQTTRDNKFYNCKYLGSTFNDCHLYIKQAITTRIVDTSNYTGYATLPLIHITDQWRIGNHIPLLEDGNCFITGTKYNDDIQPQPKVVIKSKWQLMMIANAICNGFNDFNMRTRMFVPPEFKNSEQVLWQSKSGSAETFASPLGAYVIQNNRSQIDSDSWFESTIWSNLLNKIPDQPYGVDEQNISSDYPENAVRELRVCNCCTTINFIPDSMLAWQYAAKLTILKNNICNKCNGKNLKKNIDDTMASKLVRMPSFGYYNNPRNKNGVELTNICIDCDHTFSLGNYQNVEQTLNNMWDLWLKCGNCFENISSVGKINVKNNLLCRIFLGTNPNYVDELFDSTIELSAEVKRLFISHDARTVNRYLANMQPIVIPINGQTNQQVHVKFPGVTFVGSDQPLCTNSHTIIETLILGSVAIVSRLMNTGWIATGIDDSYDTNWLPNLEVVDSINANLDGTKILMVMTKEQHWHRLCSLLEDGINALTVVYFNDLSNIATTVKSNHLTIFAVEDMAEVFVNVTHIFNTLQDRKVIITKKHAYLIRRYFNTDNIVICSLTKISKNEDLSNELTIGINSIERASILMPTIGRAGSLGWTWRRVEFNLNKKLFEQLYRRAMYKDVSYNTIMETGLGAAMTRYNLKDRTIPWTNATAEEVYQHVNLVKVMANCTRDAIDRSLKYTLTGKLMTAGHAIASELLEMALSKMGLREQEIKCKINEIMQVMPASIFNEIETSWKDLINSMKYVEGYGTCYSDNQCPHRKNKDIDQEISGSNMCYCCGVSTNNLYCHSCSATIDHPNEHYCDVYCEHVKTYCHICKHSSCFNPCLICNPYNEWQSLTKIMSDNVEINKVKSKRMEENKVSKITNQTKHNEQDATNELANDTGLQIPPVENSEQEISNQYEIPYENKQGLMVLKAISPAIELENNWHDHECHCGNWYRHRHKYTSVLHPRVVGDCPWHEGNLSTIKLIKVSGKLFPLIKDGLSLTSIDEMTDVEQYVFLINEFGEKYAKVIQTGKMVDNFDIEKYYMNGIYTYHYNAFKVKNIKNDTVLNVPCAQHVAEISGIANIMFINLLNVKSVDGLISINQIRESAKTTDTNVAFITNEGMVVYINVVNKPIIYFLHNSYDNRVSYEHFSGCDVEIVELPNEPLSNHNVSLQGFNLYCQTLLKQPWSWDNRIMTDKSRIKLILSINVYNYQVPKNNFDIIKENNVIKIMLPKQVNNIKHIEFDTSGLIDILNMDRESYHMMLINHVSSYAEWDIEKELQSNIDWNLLNLWRLLHAEEMAESDWSVKLRELKCTITSHEGYSTIKLNTSETAYFKDNDVVYTYNQNRKIICYPVTSNNNILTVAVKLMPGTMLYYSIESASSCVLKLIVLSKSVNINKEYFCSLITKITQGTGGSGKSTTIAGMISNNKNVFVACATSEAQRGIKHNFKSNKKLYDNVYSIESMAYKNMPDNIEHLAIDECTLFRAIDLFPWIHEAKLKGKQFTISLFGDTDQVSYIDMVKFKGSRPTESCLAVMINELPRLVETLTKQYRIANPLNNELNKIRTIKTIYEGQPKQTTFSTHEVSRYDTELIMQFIQSLGVKLDAVYCFYKDHATQLINKLHRHSLLGQDKLVKQVLRVHANQGGTYGKVLVIQASGVGNLERKKNYCLSAASRTSEHLYWLSCGIFTHSADLLTRINTTVGAGLIKLTPNLNFLSKMEIASDLMGQLQHLNDLKALLNSSKFGQKMVVDKNKLNAYADVVKQKYGADIRFNLSDDHITGVMYYNNIKVGKVSYDSEGIHVLSDPFNKIKDYQVEINEAMQQVIPNSFDTSHTDYMVKVNIEPATLMGWTTMMILDNCLSEVDLHVKVKVNDIIYELQFAEQTITNTCVIMQNKIRIGTISVTDFKESFVCMLSTSCDILTLIEQFSKYADSKIYENMTWSLHVATTYGVINAVTNWLRLPELSPYNKAIDKQFKKIGAQLEADTSNKLRLYPNNKWIGMTTWLNLGFKAVNNAGYKFLVLDNENNFQIIPMLNFERNDFEDVQIMFKSILATQATKWYAKLTNLNLSFGINLELPLAQHQDENTVVNALLKNAKGRQEAKRLKKKAQIIQWPSGLTHNLFQAIKNEYVSFNYLLTPHTIPKDDSTMGILIIACHTIMQHKSYIKICSTNGLIPAITDIRRITNNIDHLDSLGRIKFTNSIPTLKNSLDELARVEHMDNISEDRLDISKAAIKLLQNNCLDHVDTDVLLIDYLQLPDTIEMLDQMVKQYKLYTWLPIVGGDSDNIKILNNEIHDALLNCKYKLKPWLIELTTHQTAIYPKVLNRIGCHVIVQLVKRDDSHKYSLDVTCDSMNPNTTYKLPLINETLLTAINPHVTTKEITISTRYARTLALRCLRQGTSLDDLRAAYRIQANNVSYMQQGFRTRQDLLATDGMWVTAAIWAEYQEMTSHSTIAANDYLKLMQGAVSKLMDNMGANIKIEDMLQKAFNVLTDNLSKNTPNARINIEKVQHEGTVRINGSVIVKNITPVVSLASNWVETIIDNFFVFEETQDRTINKTFNELNKVYCNFEDEEHHIGFSPEINKETPISPPSDQLVNIRTNTNIVLNRNNIGKSALQIQNMIENALTHIDVNTLELILNSCINDGAEDRNILELYGLTTYTSWNNLHVCLHWLGSNGDATPMLVLGKILTFNGAVVTIVGPTIDQRKVPNGVKYVTIDWDIIKVLSQYHNLLKQFLTSDDAITNTNYIDDYPVINADLHIVNEIALQGLATAIMSDKPFCIINPMTYNVNTHLNYLGRLDQHKLAISHRASLDKWVKSNFNTTTSYTSRLLGMKLQRIFSIPIEPDNYDGIVIDSLAAMYSSKYSPPITDKKTLHIYFGSMTTLMNDKHVKHIKDFIIKLYNTSKINKVSIIDNQWLYDSLIKDLSDNTQLQNVIVQQPACDIAQLSGYCLCHGGAGTLATLFNSKCYVIILPIAFDQPYYNQYHGKYLVSLQCENPIENLTNDRPKRNNNIFINLSNAINTVTKNNFEQLLPFKHLSDVDYINNYVGHDSSNCNQIVEIVMPMPNKPFDNATLKRFNNTCIIDSVAIAIGIQKDKLTEFVNKLASYSDSIGITGIGVTELPRASAIVIGNMYGYNVAIADNDTTFKFIKNIPSNKLILLKAIANHVVLIGVYDITELNIVNSIIVSRAVVSNLGTNGEKCEHGMNSLLYRGHTHINSNIDITLQSLVNNFTLNKEKENSKQCSQLFNVAKNRSLWAIAVGVVYKTQHPKVYIFQVENECQIKVGNLVQVLLINGTFEITPIYKQSPKRYILILNAEPCGIMYNYGRSTIKFKTDQPEFELQIAAMDQNARQLLKRKGFDTVIWRNQIIRNQLHCNNYDFVRHHWDPKNMRLTNYSSIICKINGKITNVAPSIMFTKMITGNNAASVSLIDGNEHINCYWTINVDNSIVGTTNIEDSMSRQQFKFTPELCTLINKYWNGLIDTNGGYIGYYEPGNKIRRRDNKLYLNIDEKPEIVSLIDMDESYVQQIAKLLENDGKINTLENYDSKLDLDIINNDEHLIKLVKNKLHIINTNRCMLSVDDNINYLLSHTSLHIEVCVLQPSTDTITELSVPHVEIFIHSKNKHYYWRLRIGHSWKLELTLVRRSSFVAPVVMSFEFNIDQQEFINILNNDVDTDCIKVVDDKWCWNLLTILNPSKMTKSEIQEILHNPLSSWPALFTKTLSKFLTSK